MFTTRSTLCATLALPCLLPLAAGCGAGERAGFERPGFEAEVTGAVETTMRGSPVFSPSALTLSAEDGSDRVAGGGTLVFAASDGAGLSSGSYGVGPGNDAPFVNALFIAGVPSRPLGVFRGSAGALTVTTATAQRIAGRFELEAVGVVTESDTDGKAARTSSRDSTTVRVSGSFLVLDPCSAVTSQAAAPCARHSSRATEGRLRAVAVASPQ